VRKLPHTAAEDLLELVMRRYERSLNQLVVAEDLSPWFADAMKAWPAPDVRSPCEAL